MTNKKRITAVFARILGLCTLLGPLAGCGGEEANAAAGGAGGGRPGGAMPPPPVQVARAETRTVPLEIDTFGTVEPIATVEVRAQVAGELKKVWFEEGGFVTAGQELFTIDPRPYEVGLAQAEANLARAEAEVREARANADRNRAQARNAQTELERHRTLLDRGMVTQEEFDQARTAAEALQAAVQADEATVASAQEGIRAARAAIDAAQLSLGYALIRSPMDGRTGSLMAHTGDLVRQNDAEPLVTITQMKPIYVTFTLPENHLSAIRRQSAAGELQVAARLPDGAADPLLGALTFIDSTVDPATSTIRLKATFPNEDEELWPGQYSKVTVTLGALVDAVVVPSEAVQTGQQGQYVYVVGAEKTAQMRAVKAGATFERHTVIEEGLEPGEVVVTEGHLRVAPDMPVRILEEDAPAAAPEAAA